MIYQIGQKVRIRDHTAIHNIPGNIDCSSMNNSMREYIGKIATIKIITNLKRYRMDIDNQKWSWSPCMFEIAGKLLQEKKIYNGEKLVNSKMNLSKHIKKIGIEFEGFYSDTFIRYIENNMLDRLINDIGTDGSLNNDDYTRAKGLSPKELRSVPTREPAQLIELLSTFQKAKNEGEYYNNNSVGLHYHISLDLPTYGAINNIRFYNAYMDMFKKNYTVVFEDRAKDTYCMAHLRDKYSNLDTPEQINRKHFTRSSYSRYTMINYCFSKHGTVEFRGFGGYNASFMGLSNMIMDTSRLIDEFVKQSYSMEAHIPEVEKITKKPITYDIKIEKNIAHTIARSYQEGKAIKRFKNNTYNTRLRGKRQPIENTIINIILPARTQGDYIPF